jgi:hypothetical protein
MTNTVISSGASSNGTLVSGVGNTLIVLSGGTATNDQILPFGLKKTH